MMLILDFAVNILVWKILNGISVKSMHGMSWWRCVEEEEEEEEEYDTLCTSGVGTTI